MKSKVGELNVDKLVAVPEDLTKLSVGVKNEIVKKADYNTKIKDIEDKIPDITNWGTTASLNTKIVAPWCSGYHYCTIHSAKTELRFSVGSNPARGV